ncbi:MAG TPA: hypothetical protein PLP01_10880 [Phycisphaerae bacterium]|nr:hypothetical protein [Phycisphaerae bacterium]
MSEITGLGSRVGYADALVAAGGPTVYTMVSGVHKITPPAGPAAQDIAVPAALDGDGHKGHLPGSDDTPSMTFHLPYASAIRNVLTGLRRLAKRWLVLYPDGDADLLAGHVAKISEEEIDADSLLTTAAEVVVSAMPTPGQSLGDPDAEFTVTLAAGAGTVDLTDLPDDVDGTGLPLARVMVTNHGAANLTISSPGDDGEHDGYEWQDEVATTGIVIPPGKTVVLEGDATTKDISATCRLLTLAGTGTETSDWVVTFGAA